jgi:hypothetical protein
VGEGSVDKGRSDHNKGETKGRNAAEEASEVAGEVQTRSDVVRGRQVLTRAICCDARLSRCSEGLDAERRDGEGWDGMKRKAPAGQHLPLESWPVRSASGSHLQSLVSRPRISPRRGRFWLAGVKAPAPWLHVLARHRSEARAVLGLRCAVVAQPPPTAVPSTSTAAGAP